MTSIKRVGALFVEDNGPHHVVILEAELPRALRSSAGSRWCVLASRGMRGWTEARASCSPNPLEIGVNSGSSACSGPDFKYWEFFPVFFFYSIASAKMFSFPAEPLWSKSGAGVLLLVGGFTWKLCAQAGSSAYIHTSRGSKETVLFSWCKILCT